MSVDEILTEVEKQRQIIIKEIKQEDEELELFKNFFENNSLIDIDGLINLNLSDLLIVYIKSKNPSIPFGFLKEKVYSISEVIENTNAYKFKTIISCICNIFENNKKVELKDILRDNNEHRSTRNINKYFKDDDITRLITEYISKDKNEKVNYSNLIDLLEYDFELMKRSLVIINILKQMMDDKEKIVGLCFDLEKDHNKKAKQKHKEKAMEQTLKDIYKINNIKKELDVIINYYKDYESKNKSKMRKITKELNNYNNFERQFLTLLEKDTITNYKELITKITNNNLRLNILKFIYNYNEKQFIEIQKEYEDLSKNSVVNYQAILDKKGLLSSNYNLEEIMKNSIKDVEDILNMIDKLKITDQKDILNILQKSDKDIVTNILEFNKMGILSQDLIKNNINLFNKSTNEYENLLKNLKNLEDIDINTHSFGKFSTSLLIPNNVFANNIKVIKEYNLEKSMKTASNSTYLESIDLEIKIDMLLELGYEEFIKKDLAILSYSIEKYQRLQLYKQLNEKIKTIEELYNILNNNKFIIADDKLNEYIYNETIYRTPTNIEKDNINKNVDLTSLKQYEYSDLTYKINGILISKNKVQRNIKRLYSSSDEDILMSIIYNSTLNDNEYNIIEKSIIKSKNNKSYK